MNDFVEHLRAEWPPERWHEERTVLAVSGGADSIALLRAMHALAGDHRDRLTVAHFNHQLRGDDSDADEAFVRDLAETCGLRFRVSRAEENEISQPGQDGLEATARRARYDFLEQTCNDIGARYLLTAHTADDQAETVLHRILRGTGLIGLEGISLLRELSELTTLVRPLLGFTRQEVIQYLSELNQSFREDKSNADASFTRNRIRQLLPILERQFNPRLRNALNSLALQAGDLIELCDELTEDWYELALADADNQIALDLKFFHTQPECLIRHFLVRLWQEHGWPLQAMTFEHWEMLCEILCPDPQGPPSFDLPGNIRVRLSQRATKVVIRAPMAENTAEPEPQ